MPRLKRFFKTLLSRLDELLRNGATDNGIDEFEAFARVRFEANPYIAVLTMAAGLLDVTAFGLARAFDRFAVVDLRFANVGFNAEFAAHTVNEDIELKLADATDDGLAGFVIGMNAEGRVFLSQLGEGDFHLFHIGFRLRLHRFFKHRLREDKSFQNDGLIRIGEVSPVVVAFKPTTRRFHQRGGR
jgi:hypothetical protein